MWPKLLDIPKDQCVGLLRNLECQAYTCLVDAFRAGGILTEDKKCCLENVAKLLNISTERHKAEVRRAVNDELLTTISSRLSGPDPDYTWTREGRRIIPVLPRANISTSLTPVAQRAAESVARHNATLLRPSQTRTAPPPPSLPKPDHLLGSSPPLPAAAVPDNDHLHNGVPEITVKPELKPRTAVVDTSSDNNSDNGVVVLPSGTAVRVSSNQTKPGRGGKRKRSASVSKSIEVFPGGLAQLEAAAVKIEAGDGSDKSPSRKVTSVLGAGHGYARPLPSNSPLPDRQVVLPLMDPSVTKRGPGRPPGPASPQLMAGRGRPRLLSGGTRGRGGAKPRGGVLITPRMATPLTQPQLLQATPTSLALRPTSGVASSPRATTIQLKQETSTSGLTNPALQGLKVISHSSTKIVPKSATAVYVVPSMGRSSSVSAMPGSGQRIVTVNTLPRVLSSSGHVMTPTLPGVIKTVRPGVGAGKPSVIVLQKGAGLPSVSGGVALYRPARARVVSGTPAPPGHAPSANNLYVVDMSAQTLNRTTQVVNDAITDGAATAAATPTIKIQTEDHSNSNGDVAEDLSNHQNREIKNHAADPENNVVKENRDEPINNATDLKGNLPNSRPLKESEEQEIIPTYDLSTGENITNVIESEILENNHDNNAGSNGQISQE